ncbi:hypothetical protein ABZ023_30865 [Streptomyces sp. NPDC006367]|uniref:hypothetical protein n=1 Tax=unclassified Streptomyces TaxID=2593676 RepID=UPI0033ACAD47
MPDTALDIEATAPLGSQDAADAARLLALAESIGIDPVGLYDAVHDAAARYASDHCNATSEAEDPVVADAIYDEAGRQAADVNNSGLSGQVDYLVVQYGPRETEEIIRAAAR